MKTDKQLKVSNPCPFLLARMKKDEGGYYCSSCSKTIIDFRQKTEQEIRASIDENTCGIFHLNQLKGQQRLSGVRLFAFYCLTVLSFLGFSVKPVYGKTDTEKTKYMINQLDPGEKDKKQKKKKQSIQKKKNKKGTIRVIGTPSF